jgi:predicted nucleotidyltransferase
MLSEADIGRIVERIVVGCAPLVVGSFGSYAVGRAHTRSDLDLFIIQRTSLPPFARRRAVMQHLFGVLHPLDVHVFTPGEFEDGVREELSFAWIIVRQARIYHWSASAAHWVPSLRAPC